MVIFLFYKYSSFLSHIIPFLTNPLFLPQEKKGIGVEISRGCDE